MALFPRLTLIFIRAQIGGVSVTGKGDPGRQIKENIHAENGACERRRAAFNPPPGHPFLVLYRLSELTPLRPVSDALKL